MGVTVDQHLFQKWGLMSILLEGLLKLEGTVPGPCMVLPWLYPWRSRS